MGTREKKSILISGSVRPALEKALGFSVVKGAFSSVGRATDF